MAISLGRKPMGKFLMRMPIPSSRPKMEVMLWQVILPPLGLGIGMFGSKLDLNGNVTWKKTLGGGSYDIPTQFYKLQKGIILLLVLQLLWGWVSDFWILSLDSNGIISWQKTYGGRFLMICLFYPTDYRWRLHCGRLY